MSKPKKSSDRLTRAESLSTVAQALVTDIDKTDSEYRYSREVARLEADRLLKTFNTKLASLREVLADLKLELAGLAEELT